MDVTVGLRAWRLVCGLACACMGVGFSGVALAQAPALDYVVRAGTAQDVQRLTAAPAARLLQLPDLSPYTSFYVMESVRRQTAHRPRADVRVDSMLTEPGFGAFTAHGGRLREWVRRQASLPKVIVIAAGYITPRELARVLPKEVFEETEPGLFTARLPISVRAGATLHVAADVRELRLSMERGAFLVNQGQLFVTGSQIRSWSETKRQPVWFERADRFRPFVVSTSGSRTVIVDSTLAHLGFDALKSYGLTLSDADVRSVDPPRPTALVIGSELYDNWYGFYSSGAQDVILRANSIHDNLQCGIAVRERARQVILVDNRVSKSRHKHGVVVAGDSAERWILDNEVFDNAGSGIAMEGADRSIAVRNQIHGNAADGLTVYESDHTTVWGNLMAYNKRHGIRVRNSELVLRDNTVLGNARSGIYGYAAPNVEAVDKAGHRMSAPQGSLTLVGGQLIDNGASPLELTAPLSLELYDVDMHQPAHAHGIVLAGVLGPHQAQLLDILVRRKLPVMLRLSVSGAAGALGAEEASP